MPIFDFHMEAQDGSGHFRRGQVEAASKEEAREILERQEYKRAAWQMDPAREAEVLDASGAKSLDALKPPKREDFDAREQRRQELSPQHRGWLSIHHQSKPYKITSLKEAS